MPPAIIAGAIAIGASYAASVGIISIAMAAVITVAATVAASLLTKTSIPSIGSYTNQQERKQVLRASAAAQTYVYGKTVKSGLLFFAEEEPGDQDDGEWVHLAIAIAAHEIDHIGDIWLGDDLISTYGSNATWELHNNRTTADPYMLAKCPSWKTDMIGKGIAWVRLSLKFDQDKFPAGIPNFKCEVYGKKCYDPRDGATRWTDNAALCILDFYRSVLQVQDSELRMEEFIQGANICAESISAGSSNEPRYRLNGAIDLDEAMASVLDDMHETCAGEPTYIGGMHGILVGAYYGPATMTLTESQIVGNVKIIPETQWSDKANMVTGKFVDPKQGYTETDFPPVKVPAWILEDGMEFPDDQNYRFVTSEFQAQRLAQIKLNRKRLGRTMEIPLNFHGYQYRPGYYVNVVMPSLGINGVEFRVTKWDLQPTGGVTVTVRQETAAVWGDAVGQPIDRPDLTQLPGPTVPAPTNVQWVPVASNAEVNYQGVLSWVNSQPVDFTQVIIQGGGKTIVSQQSRQNAVQVNGLDKGIQYTAYLRNSAKGGILSSITQLQFTLAIDSKYYGDIYANNGYFKGTVYANNIVGDIYNKAAGIISGVNTSGMSWASTAGEHVMWTIPGDEFDRILDSNITMKMASSNRQYFTILVRTPGRPDVQIAYFDTGNDGGNSPLYFALEGITIPLCGRDQYNQLIVVVGENRTSTLELITPVRIMDVMNVSSGSAPPPWGIARYDREKNWVALYKKGRTPVISSET